MGSSAAGAPEAAGLAGVALFLSTAAITFFLNPEYNMLVYREDSNGNDPPQMKFGPSEPMLVGPNVGFAQQLTGTVNQPVALRMWASDAPPSEKNWENIVSAQNRPKAIVPARDQIAIIGGQVVNAGGGAPRPSRRGACPLRRDLAALPARAAVR